MAPVLAAANKEGLHANLPALGREREDVGIPHPARVDRLRALDKGRRAQPIAQNGRRLEIECLGSLCHLRFEIGLHLARTPGEKVLRLTDQACVIFLGNAPHAGRRTPLDLVEQAGPVAIVKEAVGAVAQQEQLLQRVERGVHRTRAGKRSVIIALRPPRPAMLVDAREGVIGAQQDEREALVVTQQHVERRAKSFDQLRFEQQRLGLAIGGDDLHAARLRHHALEPVGQLFDLSVIRHPRL